MSNVKIKNIKAHITCATLLWVAALPLAWGAVPAVVLATLNIQPDDSKGNDAHSFVLMDVDADKAWHFLRNQTKVWLKARSVPYG